jgi:hypothetical protein
MKIHHSSLFCFGLSKIKPDKYIFHIFLIRSSSKAFPNPGRIQNPVKLSHLASCSGEYLRAFPSSISLSAMERKNDRGQFDFFSSTIFSICFTILLREKSLSALLLKTCSIKSQLFLIKASS